MLNLRINEATSALTSSYAPIPKKTEHPSTILANLLSFPLTYLNFCFLLPIILKSISKESDQTNSAIIIDIPTADPINF